MLPAAGAGVVRTRSNNLELGEAVLVLDPFLSEVRCGEISFLEEGNDSELSEGRLRCESDREDSSSTLQVDASKLYSSFILALFLGELRGDVDASYPASLLARGVSSVEDLFLGSKGIPNGLSKSSMLRILNLSLTNFFCTCRTCRVLRCLYDKLFASLSLNCRSNFSFSSIFCCMILISFLNRVFSSSNFALIARA